MALKAIRGGFLLADDDAELVNKHKSLTKIINDKFIQVGAIYLKPSSKFPVDDDWYKSLKGDVNLQDWIDDPEDTPSNAGFILHQGWTDIDIDSDDSDYNRAIVAGLAANGVDTRFGFGRRSLGTPSHFFVQLSEEESRIFDALWRFEPKQFQLGDKKFHTQIRSMQTSIKEVNLVKSAKQTVMPGSVYAAKVDGPVDYDISVWYGRDGLAKSVTDIATTTPRTTSFMSIVRGIAFGTVAYLLGKHWVSGQRQATAVRVTGWLARLMNDSKSVNEHEVMANDVFCPLADEATIESFLKFLCGYFGDDEPFMRVRAFYDASEKLSRNPDAKIPGWYSLVEMMGAEAVHAIRTVVMPGSDVTKLTEMVERYVYDESDNSYIDRQRHVTYGKFVHTGEELDRRHKGDTLFIGGKPREAFKIFESSTLRKRVGFRDMFPDLSAGGIYRIDNLQNVVPDEADVDASIVFNTWKGWAIGPDHADEYQETGALVARLDRLLNLLTRDNAAQVDWIKDWIAWIFQHPGDKQQIALVVVGDQGVGKSFFGNIFMRALLTERLWSAASPKILDQNFTIGPFKDKMFCFIDEADFSRNHSAVDEIKKLIRNTDISGMEKFEEARSYRIYSRLMFASNKQNVGISQRDVRDRALFYVRTYDAAYLGKTEPEFRAWAEDLKPFFDDFGAVLRNRVAISAFIKYFMDRFVDRHTIESIKLSSGDDPDIAAANMSWGRRVAKGILESGYIASEDLDWAMPFDVNSLNARVLDECKRQGLSAVRSDVVLKEFKDAGIVTNFVDKVHGVTMRLFRMQRWGVALKVYGEVTGLKLTPYREPDDEDMDDKVFVSADRPKRRGIRPPLAGKF